MKKFITLITIMMVSASIGLCGFARNYRKTITSIGAMTLTLQGMRGANVYEIAHVDGRTELRRFRKVYSNGEDILELEKTLIADVKLSKSFVLIENSSKNILIFSKPKTKSNVRWNC